MANEFYSYEGIRNGATYLLDSTTTTAIADDTDSLIGKVVTLVGNYEVGYGSAGATPLGFVQSVEKESANSEKLVVAIVFNQAGEEVECAGSETAGAFAQCDGKGGIAVSTTYKKATIYGVNSTDKVCTVYISG